MVKFSKKTLRHTLLTAANLFLVKFRRLTINASRLTYPYLDEYVGWLADYSCWERPSSMVRKRTTGENIWAIIFNWKPEPFLCKNWSMSNVTDLPWACSIGQLIALTIAIKKGTHWYLCTKHLEIVVMTSRHWLGAQLRIKLLPKMLCVVILIYPTTAVNAGVNIQARICSLCWEVI